MESNIVEFKPNKETVNPEISKELEKDSPLKDWLVDYVGNHHNPENDEVTLAMVIDVMAKEFPEFLLALAEENFIRGYQQAMADIDEGEKLMRKEGLI